MSNLFASSQPKDVIVQFKAGVMHFNSDTKMVTPDSRKGTIIVKKDDEELTHFIWRDRKTGQAEIDLTIFPEDAIFRKIEESKGRVYLLEFKTTSEKRFFWMQETETEKDQEYLIKVNDGLNGTTTPSKSNEKIQEDKKDEQIQRTEPKQSTQSSSMNPPPQQQPSQNADSLRDYFYRVIQNMETNSPLIPSPNLEDVINTQEVISTGVLEDDEVIKELQLHLPENAKDSALETLRSPQFKQAVSALNEAIKKGQLQEMLASFELELPKDSEKTSNIETFLLALQEKVNRERGKK